MRKSSYTNFGLRMAAGAAIIAASLSGHAQQVPALASAQKVWIPGKGMMYRMPIVRTSVAHSVTPASVSGSDQALCADNEFVASPSSAPAAAALVSRHKYCQEYQNYSDTISVDLMKRTVDSQYEYYRPGIPFHEVRTFNVGNLTIRTRAHAFGGVGGLSKTHRFDISVAGFAFDSQFPAHLRAGVSVRLDPDPMVITYNESSIQNFSIGAVGSILPIRLDGSNPSGSTGSFDVVVNWDFIGTDPLQNYVRFAALIPRYIYTVSDTPRYGTTDKFTISADSGSAWLSRQLIRCDKYVASGSTPSPSTGCIFEEASPVMIMSKSGNGAEGALHIEQAQTTRDAYKTQYSPGFFIPAAGTRAVADESRGEQSLGLVRGDGNDSDLNRNATCKLAGSLVNVRPFSGSPSCPTKTSPDCGCDEYPFATTKNGGYYNPAGTSAKYILNPDNSSGGGQLSSFFKDDRVFPGEKFWVKIVP